MEGIPLFKPVSGRKFKYWQGLCPESMVGKHLILLSSIFILLMSTVTAEIQLEFGTDPKELSVEEPATLLFRAKDTETKALVKNVQMGVSIIHPEDPLFSGGQIAGTPLFLGVFSAPQGEVRIEKVHFPISGKYSMEVKIASSTAAFKPVEKTLTLQVAEHHDAERTNWILGGIGLIAGMAVGWFLPWRKRT